MEIEREKRKEKNLSEKERKEKKIEVGVREWPSKEKTKQEQGFETLVHQGKKSVTLASFSSCFCAP